MPQYAMAALDDPYNWFPVVCDVVHVVHPWYTAAGRQLRRLSEGLGGAQCVRIRAGLGRSSLVGLLKSHLTNQSKQPTQVALSIRVVSVSSGIGRTEGPQCTM